MTLRTALGYAAPPANFTGAPAWTSTLIDAAAEKAAFVFQVPRTGNIRTVRFMTGTVTTGDTLKVGLYTLDTSGDPTATPYGGMVAQTVAVADGDDNVEKTVTLATDAAAVAGDFVALVISFNSYVAGNLNVRITAGGGVGFFPYGDAYTTSWTKSGTSGVFALAYDDGVYEYSHNVEPWTSAFAGISFASNTAGADEYGNRFALPYPVRIRGAFANLAVPAASDYELLLYDGTTALQTLTVDGGYCAATTQRGRIFLFNTPQIVPAAAVRRLAIRPTTTNAVVLWAGTVGVAAAMNAAPMGADCYQCKRIDQGAWDDTGTTIRPFIYPIYDQLDHGGEQRDGPTLSVPLRSF